MISVNDYEIALKFFPDGTLNLTDLGGMNSPFYELTEMGAEAVAHYRPDFTIIWKYDQIEEQVLLWNIVSHLRDKCMAGSIELILPYIPNARMDRTKAQFTEVHTLKYFAEFLNIMGFDAVYVLDPHSDVSVSLINNCVTLPINELVEFAVDDFKPDFIFLPDKGSLSRYDKVVTRPPFYGEKDRDWKTGRINGLTVHNPYKIAPENYAGKRILIIDDICSRGGTFVHAAAALKEMGFGEIGLYVTHCEKTIHMGEILKENSNIVQVYTTDSLYGADGHDKITILPLEFEI